MLSELSNRMVQQLNTLCLCVCIHDEWTMGHLSQEESIPPSPKRIDKANDPLLSAQETCSAYGSKSLGLRQSQQFFSDLLVDWTRSWGAMLLR